MKRISRRPRRAGARRIVARFPILSLVLLLVVFGLGVRIAEPSALVEVRDIVFDEYQRYRPRPYDPDAPVRIVAIDEGSLERLGQWPWPRVRLAQLLDALYRQGAATVALDLLLAEPDRMSPESIIELVPDGEAREQLAERLRALPSNDSVLAGAVGQGGTVLGIALQSEPGDGAPLDPKAGFAFAGDDPRPFLPHFSSVTAPLPVLAEAASGLGAMNWIPDRDQIVRTVPLVFAVGERFYPSFAAEALRVAQGAGAYVIRSSNASGQSAFGAESGINAIRIGAFEVATESDGAVRIHFSRFARERYIPAWKVLAGEVPDEEIAGRIILVGATAAGLLDLRATPIDAAVPGIDVHAQVIEHILSGSRLVRPDWAPALEMLAFTVLALVFGFAARSLAAASSIAVGVIALAAVAVASYFAFVRYDLLIDPSFPILAGGIVLVATNGYVGIREEHARRQIRTAFSRYVAPDLVEELAADPRRLKLGGETREMTILFADIRGFTGIAEGMGAEELTSFINAFLTPLTDVILKHRGTIDKYMGDAIMAFWNAPLDDPEHARHACEAALGMRDALAAFNRSRRTAGLPEVEIGIGINSGVSCVGNLGSQQRFDYSVIGDDVNVASRLEGQTRNYGVPIIVGPETVAEAPGFAFVEIDRVRVKGRGHALDIFALLGGAERAAQREFQCLNDAMRALLEAYRTGDFDTAEVRVEALAVLEPNPLAEIAAIYRERIARYADVPLPPEWNGTHALLTK